MRKMKRWIAFILVVASLMASSISVMADTVEFDITVPGDIISKKTSKGDTEQKFYVTGTSFSNNNTLMCISVQIENPNIQSNTASIASSRVSANASYSTYAKDGVNYYMTTRTYQNTNLRVTGRYTP